MERSEGGTPPHSGGARLRRSRLLPTIASAVGLTMALVLTLAALGWRTSVMDGDAMRPFADAGDLLVHRPVAAAELEPGDVVSLRTADQQLLTRTVADAEPGAAGVWLRLSTPDGTTEGARLLLDGDTHRVAFVVPRLGGALVLWAPLLWTGLGIALLAWSSMENRRARRGTGAPRSLPAPVVASQAEAVAKRTPPTGDVTLLSREREDALPAGHDVRLIALIETAEELVERGLAPLVAWDLVRVRLGVLLGLPRPELSGAVRSLDDGARFYVLSLVDADEGALRSIPLDSARRRAGSHAVSRWWIAVDAAVPPPVLDVVDALQPRGS